MSDHVGVYIPSPPSLGSVSNAPLDGYRRISSTEPGQSRTTNVGDPFQASAASARRASSDKPQPRGAADQDLRSSQEQLKGAVESLRDWRGAAEEFVHAVQQAAASFDAHIRRFGTSSGPCMESISKANLNEEIDNWIQGVELDRISPALIAELHSVCTRLDFVATATKLHPMLGQRSEPQFVPRASPIRRDTFDEKSFDDRPAFNADPGGRLDARPAPPLPRLPPAQEKKTRRAVAELFRLLQTPAVPGFAGKVEKIVRKLPRGDCHDIEFHRIFSEHLRNTPVDQRSQIDQRAQYIGEPYAILINAACQGRPAPGAQANYPNDVSKVGRLLYLFEVIGTTGKSLPHDTPHENDPWWIYHHLRDSEFPTGHFDYKRWRKIADRQVDGMGAEQLGVIEKGIAGTLGPFLESVTLEQMETEESEGDVHMRLFPAMLLDAVAARLQHLREADRPMNSLQKAGRFMARPLKALLAYPDRRIAQRSKMRQQVNGAISNALIHLSRPTNDSRLVNSALNVISNAMPGSRGEAGSFDLFVHFVLGRSPRDYALRSERDRILFKEYMNLALSKLSTDQVLGIADNIERRVRRPQDTIQIDILRRSVAAELRRRQPDREAVAVADDALARGFLSPGQRREMEHLRSELRRIPASSIENFDDDKLRRIDREFRALGGFDSGIEKTSELIANRTRDARAMYSYELRIAMSALNDRKIGEAMNAMNSANEIADELVAWELHALGFPMGAEASKTQRQQIVDSALQGVQMPTPDRFEAISDDQLRQVDAAFRRLSGFPDGTRLTGGAIASRVAIADARFTADFSQVTRELRRLNFAATISAMATAEASARHLLVWEQHATGELMGNDESSKFLQDCVTRELARRSPGELSFLLGITQRGYGGPGGELVEWMDALKFYGYDSSLAESHPDVLNAMTVRFYDMLRIAEGVREVFTSRKWVFAPDQPEPEQSPEPNAKMKELLKSAFGLGSA